MMRTIYKYPVDRAQLGPDNGVDMRFPQGAELLYAAAQGGQIVIYAMVDAHEPVVTQRRVRVYGTGHTIMHSPQAKPLGVCAFFAGNLMFHVFAEPEVGA